MREIIKDKLRLIFGKKLGIGVTGLQKSEWKIPEKSEWKSVGLESANG